MLFAADVLGEAVVLVAAACCCCRSCCCWFAIRCCCLKPTGGWVAEGLLDGNFFMRPVLARCFMKAASLLNSRLGPTDDERDGSECATAVVDAAVRAQRPVGSSSHTAVGDAVSRRNATRRQSSGSRSTQRRRSCEPVARNTTAGAVDITGAPATTGRSASTVCCSSSLSLLLLL